MREYWKSSLFLYQVVESEPTPIIMFWRATVFTFGKPAKKKILKRLINEHAEKDIETFTPQQKSKAWEKRQVDASASRGLGFNWIEVCRGERRHGRLSPEERVGVYQLQAEAHNVRLGQSEFMGRIRLYGKDKRYWQALGLAVKSFWEWLAS